MSYCRGCNREIVWGTLPNGTRIPLDASEAVYTVSDDGVAAVDESLRALHFPVCPSRERDLAWAAGLFEGEGNIRINSPTTKNNGALACGVTNTDRQVVDFFQERWPGSLRPVCGLRPDQKPAWYWVVASRQARRFLLDVLPFIQTQRVIRKATLALEYQAQKRCSWAARTSEYRERQRDYFLRMKALNVRGTGFSSSNKARGPG